MDMICITYFLIKSITEQILKTNITEIIACMIKKLLLNAPVTFKTSPHNHFLIKSLFACIKRRLSEKLNSTCKSKFRTED